MKRIACFLLVALMLAVGGASAGEKDYAAMLEQQKAEGLLHLWDIPFGITIDEFMELAEEKTETSFAVIDDEENIPRYCLVWMEKDKVENLKSGEGLTISSDFYHSSYDREKGTTSYHDGQEELNAIESTLSFSKEVSITEWVLRCVEIQSKLIDKYGLYNDQYIFVFNDESTKEYVLINEDGTLHQEGLAEAIYNNEAAVLKFAWKNVEMHTSFIKQGGGPITISIKDRMIQYE